MTIALESACSFIFMIEVAKNSFVSNFHNFCTAKALTVLWYSTGCCFSMSELYERTEKLCQLFWWHDSTADVFVASFFLTRVSVWIPDGNRSHKVPFNRRMDKNYISVV